MGLGWGGGGGAGAAHELEVCFMLSLLESQWLLALISVSINRFVDFADCGFKSQF